MSDKKVEIDKKIRDQMKGGQHDVLVVGPGFNYKSPIEIFQKNTIIQNVRDVLDNEIYCAVINADIKVDREELIKALQYDRGQYEKGYADGRRDAEKHGQWVAADEQPYFRKHYHTMVCSECGKRRDGKWNFCPKCGAKMEEGKE